jgi:molybdate transport system substrate-binding protein
MIQRALAAAALLALLALALGPRATGGAAGAGQTVMVSAAVSLTNVLEELARSFEAQSGRRVILNFGASNVLARQIAAGAGIDLFISAHPAAMEMAGPLIDPSSRVNLLTNQLAIAVPQDRPRRFASAHDLTDPSIRRIAIGDPAAVPAGMYAKAYLERLGIWTRISGKLVPSGSVRAALAAVESGAADAAVVYATDIASARRAREAFVVPPADAPPIVYPAAIVRGGRGDDGAREFLAFLQGAEASMVFHRAGFRRP